MSAANLLRDHEFCLYDETGECRAELTDALATLLDAVERRLWVGRDAAMDAYLRATEGLLEAAAAVEAAISREGRSE